MKRIRKWHPIVKINANNGTPRGKENLIKIKVEGLSSIAVDGPHKTSYLETSLAAIIDTIEDNTSLVNQIVVVHGGSVRLKYDFSI